jgi:DNA-binding transcriptional LysR family regulator
VDILKKIRGFDLNLLAVFAAIVDHRHITKAAKVLGITQPALSHALGRLRILLDDDLFVKSSRGMVPTPRAVQISEPIRSLLGQFEREVLGLENFDPSKMRRAFKIYTTDLIDSLLLPSLLKKFETSAPGAQIVSQAAPFSLPREELELGKCDLAIAGFFGELPDGFYQQKLFSDGFVSAVRRNHPRLGKRKELSLTEFCDERHVLVAPGGELRAKVDELLAKKKIRRTIVAGLNSFMSSAWIIPETDYIFTGPTRLVRLIERAFPLHVLATPVKIPDITITQVWHERNNNDDGHRWLREHIRGILQD